MPDIQVKHLVVLHGEKCDRLALVLDEEEPERGLLRLPMGVQQQDQSTEQFAHVVWSASGCNGESDLAAAHFNSVTLPSGTAVALIWGMALL